MKMEKVFPPVCHPTNLRAVGQVIFTSAKTLKTIILGGNEAFFDSFRVGIGLPRLLISLNFPPPHPSFSGFSIFHSIPPHSLLLFLLISPHAAVPHKINQYFHSPPVAWRCPSRPTPPFRSGDHILNLASQSISHKHIMFHLEPKMQSQSPP